MVLVFFNQFLVALLNTVQRSDVANVSSLNYLFRSTGACGYMRYSCRCAKLGGCVYSGQVIGMALSSSVQQFTLGEKLQKAIQGPNSAYVRVVSFI